MRSAKKGKYSIYLLNFPIFARRQFAAFCSERSERTSKMRPSKLPRKEIFLTKSSGFYKNIVCSQLTASLRAIMSTGEEGLYKILKILNAEKAYTRHIFVCSQLTASLRAIMSTGEEGLGQRLKSLNTLAIVRVFCENPLLLPRASAQPQPWLTNVHYKREGGFWSNWKIWPKPTLTFVVNISSVFKLYAWKQKSTNIDDFFPFKRKSQRKIHLRRRWSCSTSSEGGFSGF